MEFRTRPDFEIGPEMDDIVIDRDLTLAVMDRVRRIGMDELADDARRVLELNYQKSARAN